MSKIYVLMFFVCTISLSNAQRNFMENRPFSIGIMVRTIYYPGISFSIKGLQSYQPGIRVGTELNIKSWVKEKERKENSFFIKRNFCFSPQVGVYTHYKNHTGLLLNIDVDYQVFRSKTGVFYAFGLGIGLIERINKGGTYIVQPNGSIREKKWGSRSYFYPSVKLEFGKTITSDLLYYIKGTIGMLSSYNTRKWAIPDSFIETGVRFNFSGNKN